MDSSAAVRCAASFESILVYPLLAPLCAGSSDAFGEYGGELMAETIARHDRTFSALLAAQLERR